MKTGLLIAVTFTVFFIFLLGNILALLSLLGGWRRLSIDSPVPETTGFGDISYTFQSVRLGLISYNRCARIRFTGAGVIFSTIWPFTFMHSPFIIRYEKITNVKTGNLFGPYIEFTAENKKIRLTGKSSLELERRLRAADLLPDNHN